LSGTRTKPYEQKGKKLMPDIVASITKAPSAFWGTIKTYWIFFILALAALLVVIMAKKDAIVGWFTTSGSATKGDKLPAFLRGLGGDVRCPIL
jgi:hypothetical protein